MKKQDKFVMCEVTMKKIYLEPYGDNTIHYSLISECDPIFAKKDGKLCGMIVNEEGKGWITRLGGTFGANGHCDNLCECIRKGQQSGYEYYT